MATVLDVIWVRGNKYFSENPKEKTRQPCQQAAGRANQAAVARMKPTGRREAPPDDRLRSIRATMFANVIARSDLSTGKSQHGRRMGGACETHHLYKMQWMGIASAFRLRSASYGGRSRSLSYGGQVAPLIRAPVRMASSARWRVKDRGKR